MNSFVNALREETNWTKTENGANALKSTNSSLVDLFGVIGALRNRSEDDIISLFSKAFSEDALLATKMSFYNRNVRGGLGERYTSRVIWKFLANNHPEIIRKNLDNIPYFGRWDDLYTFIGTPVEKDMWEFVKRTLNEDIESMNNNKPVTLLAKWLKSVNSNSKETNMLGRYTRRSLGMREDEYRKTLSKLRNYISVTEVKMSNNDWKSINYAVVPSKAMNNYRNAFRKHDIEGFNEYINNVKTGTAKINSTTLYPYDIVEKYMYNVHRKDDVLEEQWKALPNYVEGENNILIMADVSGSMTGRPMATSVGLATYFAERNNGAFKNLFMTFSSEPSFIELKGSTLYEKIRNVMRSPWGMSTNLELAFNLVLNTAVKNRVPYEDMPKSIIVISDMSIDRCTDVRRWTFYDSMKDKFNRYGYDIPNIVFWNVNARETVFHTKSNYKGVQLASGSSPSVFKAILEGVDLTPYEMMVKTLSNPEYNRVVI